MVEKVEKSDGEDAQTLATLNESGVVEGRYKVDSREGIAEGMPVTIDRLGKIQLQPWLRERLGIQGGAELLVSVKVVKRYVSVRALKTDRDGTKHFVEEKE